MKRIGIVAALPSELKPLTRHWNHHHHLATGRIGPIEVVAACEGMGEKAVLRACERVATAGPIDTIISVGYAGSLSCGLIAPEAVAVREVIDARTSERFLTADLPSQSSTPIKGQRLITIDHVADPEEKRSLASTWQAVLVDMEAATVARFAREKGLAFLCFKAVTDGPNDELPDFNRFTTPEGRLRTAAFVTYAILHPQYWKILGELEKNSHHAAVQLSNFVSSSLSTSVS
jgi:adenosylhomocysteine nucleosidase